MWSAWYSWCRTPSVEQTKGVKVPRSSSAAVSVRLLCVRRSVGYSFPGDVHVAGCAGTHNAIIEKCHPAILPPSPCHPVCAQLRATPSVILRDHDRLNRNTSPCHISRPGVVVPYVIMAALYQPIFGTIQAILPMSHQPVGRHNLVVAVAWV